MPSAGTTASPAPRPRQGHRLRLVDDHRRLVRRLCQDQSGRHGHAGERRGRTRHRRDDRRRADSGRGAGVDLTDINVAGVDTQLRPTITARRAAAPRSRSAMPASPPRRDLRATDVRPGRAALGVAVDAWSACATSMWWPATSRIVDRGAGARLRTSDRRRADRARHGDPPMPAFDPTRVKNHPLPAWNTPSFHAHAVDLSVDPETGEVTINRYVVAQDVGFAINPTYIEGQIEGGVAQGIGQALSRGDRLRRRSVMNANLTDYKMPTAHGHAGRRMHPGRVRQRSGPLWRQGRRRAALHPAAGDDRQCHRRGHRRSDHSRCR